MGFSEASGEYSFTGNQGGTTTPSDITFDQVSYYPTQAG